MPRPRANAAAKLNELVRQAELLEPVKSEEQVDLDEAEETMEEEVEYEEVEEEVEEEVVEEEEEEEVVEEEEVEEEAIAAAHGADAYANLSGGDDMKDAKQKDENEDESEKHAVLLALPPHGSEIYVGGIPIDASEEDVKHFSESIGEVTEVRMMKGKDENKNYAFVTFRTKQLASMAIKDLNNTDFKGKKLKCSTSQARNRLFIGNVPRNWVEDDMKKAVTQIGPGVIKVELMKDPQNSSRNRGFAFIEYYNHACAEYSRKKMSTPKFKLDSNAPTVSWADPKSGDSASTTQVKALYVKNLPKTVTQDQLKKLFEHHGEITKVVLPPAKSGHENRFGFVHFAERSMAMKALQNTERYELDGQVLECSLAKPPADNRGETSSNAKQGALLPNYRVGYGVMGSPYGAVPGFGQPLMYGRGAAPGMAMVPMILPDGRLGYVLQQPGSPVVAMQPGVGQSGGSSGSWQSNDGNRGRRYKPY